jgi:putative peptidoglycan lipid II flippase
LLLVSLVTLYGGILNALSRFAAAAAAPILLNLSMIMTLALAASFPTPGHAAAWGVLLAGFLEVLLVGGDALRNDLLTWLRWPKWDDDVRRFFKALVPATIGSAGVQIALFADTIIASFLSAGALSALYYADRLNQLPIGVIGIAAGTVLLPEMASRIAAGDEVGARRAQARAIELTLLLSIPSIIAFLLLPDLIMRALFMRGAFTAEAARAAGQTLAAYATGLLPFVLIRSITATFLARGDTATPVKASLTAVAVNVVCKILLMAPLAQVGLALATSIGAWLNLILVAWFAARHGHFAVDAGLRRSAVRIGAAGGALALALWAVEMGLSRLWPGGGATHDLGTLTILAAVGAAAYGGVSFALLGREWLARLPGRRGTPFSNESM